MEQSLMRGVRPLRPADVRRVFKAVSHWDGAGAPALSHSYATQTSLGTTTSASKRADPRRVTIFNDDGHVPWGQLTAGEKAARTTQQSFNFALIIGGGLATAAVFTFLFTDVFSPNSATAHFNRAVDQIRQDSRATDILGPGKNIRAYGEPSANKWRRNRPIASRTETDKYGTERLFMHWNVSGDLNEGVVHLQMARRADESSFTYGYLALDVRGHRRVYLENADEPKSKKKKKLGTRFLGINWEK